MDMSGVLPVTFHKYVTEQRMEHYTAIDHALWRFLVRSANASALYLAHPSHLHGLSRMGITDEMIPTIDQLNTGLRRFGWSAVPTNGLLQSEVFYEFTRRRCMPVAVDLRKADRFDYTPEPDIFHDVYGHLPMLVNPYYRSFVEKMGHVFFQSERTATSREAANLFSRISELKAQGAPAETLERLTSDLVRLRAESRSANLPEQLGRLGWWTTEYGLCGPALAPKVFGASLLSSLDEIENCRNPEVTKLEFHLGCMETPYDPTVTQSQLYVLRDLSELSVAIDQLCAERELHVPGELPESAPERVQDDSFPAARSHMDHRLTQDSAAQELYLRVGAFRTGMGNPRTARSLFGSLLDEALTWHPSDWLLLLELLEMSSRLELDERIKSPIRERIRSIANGNPRHQLKILRAIQLYEGAGRQVRLRVA